MLLPDFRSCYFAKAHWNACYFASARFSFLLFCEGPIEIDPFFGNAPPLWLPFFTFCAQKLLRVVYLSKSKNAIS
ncbi:MAG: hypothetical protein DRR16_31185 [Candidatus Parabeggiatoa sp. nov. 3]|nr:MAG: hypothetical protein DRR16_31185 [Gammaproteobacteria bacterium]